MLATWGASRGNNPASLFNNGEQGAWYDPSNFGTMYQDVQGTTAVTAVEQAVGLILDSRLGLPLGSERITNNDFATDTVWTKGTGWSIGSGVATKTAGSAAVLSQSVTLVAGTTYRVVYTITRTAGSVTAQFTGGSTVSGTARSAAGTYVDFLTAVSGNNSFEFSADATFAGTVDNVYVKAVSGNDAYQITAASRPTLRARYNLLTYSEQFDNAYWSNIALMTVSANAGTAPDGTTTADKIIPTAVSGTHQIGRLSVVTSAAYVFSVYAKAAGYDTIEVLDGTGGVNGALFNLSTGAVTNRGTGVGSAVSVGDGWYRCTVDYTTTGIRIYVPTSSSTFTGDGTSGVLLWGAQLLTPADNTSTGGAYQRIAAATDYVTVSTMGGAVFNPYLAFDGTDDSLLTQSVDFPVVTSDGQARRNLFAAPNLFDSSSWTATAMTVAANTTTAPDGTTSADTLTPTAASAAHFVTGSATAAGVNATATFSVYVKPNGYDFIRVQLSSSGANPFVYFNVTTGAVGTIANNGGTVVSTAIQNAGNGWYRCIVTALPAVGGNFTSGILLVTNADNTGTFTGNGTSGVYVWGAQFELGSTATAFQDIGTQQMTLWTGVTKLLDSATVQTIAELGNRALTQAGSFTIDVPTTVSRYRALLEGSTVASYSPSPFTAPISNVFDVSFDIGGALLVNEVIPRVNGVVTQTNASGTDAGTGNFGNYPLYIGRRNNASLPFNGRIYQFILRGAASNAAQIGGMEQYVAGKMGVTL
jgi:hypothetical protein